MLQPNGFHDGEPAEVLNDHQNNTFQKPAVKPTSGVKRPAQHMSVEPLPSVAMSPGLMKLIAFVKQQGTLPGFPSNFRDLVPVSFYPSHRCLSHTSGCQSNHPVIPASFLWGMQPVKTRLCTLSCALSVSTRHKWNPAGCSYFPYWSTGIRRFPG